MAVLGVSVGTTTSGVAVVSGGLLLRARTHSFRDTWSDEKAVLITARYERYVRQYRPKVVVVKAPPMHSRTEAILSLLKKAAAMFEYHGCMVRYVTKADVKAETGAVRNHRQLMDRAVQLYPILGPEYERALAGRNRYHAKLFDAVMAAHTGKALLAQGRGRSSNDP